MARGRIRTKPIQADMQYAGVNDSRLRMTLVALSDRYSDYIRNLIYNTYQDDELARLYRGIRMAGIYAKGSKSKVHRKILEFPNAYVLDFCDTVLTELYGPDWLNDRRALRHELIKPWWVVEKL